MQNPLQERAQAGEPSLPEGRAAAGPVTRPQDLTTFSRLLLSLYRAAQEVPVSGFQDTVLDALRPILVFDSAIWGTGTMTPTGVDVHHLHRQNFPDAMLDAFLRVRHQDSAAVRVTQQDRGTIGFSALEEFAGPGQEDILRFAREHSQYHCFVTCDIHPLTRFAQWISLFRADPQRRCTEAEIAFLSELAPHLMQALAINRRVHLERLLGDASRESWSVGIADDRGVLYHSDPRFRELVEAEWPLESGGRLPADLLAQLRRQQASVAGRKVVVQRSLEQGLFFLKARPRHAVDSLTDREFTVARMLAGGMTHKQVAAQLQRSPETVRTQIRSIFDKLGINNVTLLAPLLVLRQ